jgi:hypothetical protein
VLLLVLQVVKQRGAVFGERGDREEAAALVADLAPTPELVAGAASASLALQPVAQTLGELSAFLDRADEAAGYFAVAHRVAERWNSPPWIARAAAARAALG